MLVPVAPYPPTLGMVSLFFYFNHSNRCIVSLDFELKNFHVPGPVSDLVNHTFEEGAWGVVFFGRRTS